VPFSSGSGTSAHDPYLATVGEVRELHTRASDRSCVHVELDISRAPKALRYETGDHVAVYAANSTAVVEVAALALGLPLDTVFTLKAPAAGKG
jgi:NADPH-ferrihemoprotein reductase